MSESNATCSDTKTQRHNRDCNRMCRKAGFHAARASRAVSRDGRGCAFPEYQSSVDDREIPACTSSRLLLTKYVQVAWGPGGNHRLFHSCLDDQRQSLRSHITLYNAIYRSQKGEVTAGLRSLH